MPGFEDLHLTSAVGGALEAMGWAPTDAAARETAPTAARGHSLVAVTPPAPVYAAPALAGALSRLAADGGRALLLCPPAELDEWGALAHALARGTSLRVQVAHGASRALRRLRTEELDVLVASPETALALHRRAALKPELVRTLLLAWPEAWESTEPLDALMQDLAKDAQRLLFTSDAVGVGDLAERYARKAMTFGTLPAEMPRDRFAERENESGPAAAPEPAGPAGPVRTVHVAWQRRPQAVAELLELLDPQTLTVWAADRSQEAALQRALPLSDPSIRFAAGGAELQPSQYVVAFDLPTRERLGELLAAGEVVLLVPPGTEAYTARIANPRRPLRLPGLVDAITTEAGARRAAILRALESQRPEHAVAVLGPLFERYDPAAVAAALYTLWTEHAAGTGAGAPGAIPDIPATSKVFVGVGKKDGATPADIVATLTKDLRVDRGKIGRIELRDAFSLVELPAQEAERIAAALNGATIRRRRVTARVDRGGPSLDRGERGERGERGDRPPRTFDRSERGGPPRGDRPTGPPRGDRPYGPPRGDRPPSGPPRGGDRPPYRGRDRE